MEGWMYILLCADKSYYVGSTIDLNKRIAQHQEGNGANHTKKNLPVKLIYCEHFDTIQEAFAREHQIKKWRREKKEALIKGEHEKLPDLARCYSGLRQAQTPDSTGSDT